MTYKLNRIRNRFVSCGVTYWFLLNQTAMATEGIFRLSGSQDEIQKIKTLYEEGMLLCGRSIIKFIL